LEDPGDQTGGGINYDPYNATDDDVARYAVGEETEIEEADADFSEGQGGQIDDCGRESEFKIMSKVAWWDIC
jgi:hypothetical protein